MHHVWSFFLKNKQFSYIALLALVIFGTVGLLSIPRESSPEVRIPVAIITTVYPGASALDVEELITNQIEEQLDGSLERVKKITSTSREGLSSITVEFDAGADIDASLQDTKDEVDKVVAELPDDANDPVVSDVNFEDDPVMTVSLVSDLPVTRLITLVDDVESEIRSIPGVSRVTVSGIPDREAQVIVDQEALANFNLNVTDVVRAIQSANASLPAGSIELSETQYTVAFQGKIESPAELENIAITNRNGEPIYLRDVAFVADGVSETTTYARVSLDGQPSEPAVSLSIFKRGGGDVTRLSDAVRARLLELESDMLADTPYLITFDNGEYVKDDLRNLSMTALQTVVLVMIILLIALGWREALIAGLAIPISFLIAFIGLNVSGNTINFVSLFSLILSVGILVDSAIVITEAVHTKMKTMQSKKQAALDTIKEFHYPLTTGTFTTIAVFAPLFLVSGVSGQFIAAIPFTIIFVLIASLIVALAFVPLIASLVLKRRARSRLEEKQEELTERLQTWYRGVLDTFLSHKGTQRLFFWGMIIAFVVTLSFPFTGIVKVIFFDQEDIDFLFAEVEKPQGTVLERTDLSAREVEELFLQHSDTIESYVVEVGRGSQFGSGGLDEKLANFTLILREDRTQTSSEVLEQLRHEVARVQSAEVSVFQPNNGPPTGAPVAIKILGDDLDNVALAVTQVEQVLKTVPGATEVDTTNNSDTTEFQLAVDRGRVSQVGLDASTVAFVLRTALFGTEATSIKANGEDIDVIVKLDINQQFTTPETTNQASIDAVENVRIISPNGPVLLGTLVQSNLGRSSQSITHEDRERVGQVSAEVTANSTVRDVVTVFNEKMENVELPDGVRLEIGGETEESTQAFKEMGLSLIVGILAILAILVLQFSSYRHALYIIAIVPLSLIGVFVGLAVSGEALSFPSLMGFIALSGIVVNNSIILIDRMNKVREENPTWDIKDVVITGATSRLRPIILTTLTTVIGIIPLTYASDLWSPLAFAIMFGLSFAVFVTLLLVPMLYFKNPGARKDTEE